VSEMTATTASDSGGGAASSGAGSSPEAGTKGPANDNGGQKSASSDNGTQSSKQAGDSYGSSSSASFKGQYESGMGGPAGSNDNKASAGSDQATKADNSTTSAGNYDKGAASTQFNQAAADKQSPAPEGTPPGGGKGGGKGGGGGGNGDGGNGDGGDKTNVRDLKPIKNDFNENARKQVDSNTEQGGTGGTSKQKDGNTGNATAAQELGPGGGSDTTKQNEATTDSSNGTPKSPQMEQSKNQYDQWDADRNANGTVQQQKDASQTTNSDTATGNGNNMPENVKANPAVTDAAATLKKAGVTSDDSGGNTGGTSGSGNQDGSANARGRSPSTKKPGPGLG
jgi:hypothetical protein